MVSSELFGLLKRVTLYVPLQVVLSGSSTPKYHAIGKFYGDNNKWLTVGLVCVSFVLQLRRAHCECFVQWFFQGEGEKGADFESYMFWINLPDALWKVKLLMVEYKY